MIKTLSALRECFWDRHPEFAHHFRAKKRQNQYVCDVRVAWVDFVYAKIGRNQRKTCKQGDSLIDAPE